MNILALAGIGIVMCALLVTVRQFQTELALPLSVACGVILTGYLLSVGLPLINELRELAETGGMESRYLTLTLKAIGICLATETAADVCRDAGQSALANKLETGGKLALLLTALPLLRDVLTLAAEMIGE